MRVVRIMAPWRDEGDLDLLIEVLTALNRYYIARGYCAPLDIDTTDIRYEREPVGSEDWLTLPIVEARRRGDCEDLAAATAASYPGIGRAVVRRNSSGGYHAVVEQADGEILDPSLILGMGEDG